MSTRLKILPSVTSAGAPGRRRTNHRLPAHFFLSGWAVLFAVGAAVLCVLFAPGTAVAARMVRFRNAVPARATATRWLRRAGADEVLPMVVTLPLQHESELAALLAAQQDPGSPQFHHWLTPAEFAARFGASPADYSAVADWLRGAGFQVRLWPNRLRIDFSGSVARVEHAFGVRMNRYACGGRSCFANADAPQIPADIANHVAFVRLNTFPLAHPLVQVKDPAGGTVATMGPHDVYTAYDVNSLLNSGVNGSGQTIAVVARSDFNVSDVATFQSLFGVTPAHSPVRVFPGTNPGVGAPLGACAGIPRRQEQACIQGEEGEVLLDTEWAGAMAPGATVLVDIGFPDIDTSLMDIVNHHPEAKAISISFGACERLDASDASLFGALYAQAAAQGQTVLVASGDNGVDECLDGRGASVNVLASNANVTAIGGTALNPGFDASGAATGYVSETAWNDSLGASGGGTSTIVQKPAYQAAPGVPADGARDLPDVALLASPYTAGYVMVQEGRTIVVGGTSVGTPSWAGIVALINQAQEANGLGAFNADLYALGRAQYSGMGTAVFHDVTSGNNSFDGLHGYSAGPGFDLVTGLGTPDVARLVQVLGGAASPPTASPTPTPTATPPLTPTPTPVPCVGDCTDARAVAVTDVLTLVSIALGEAQPAVCPYGIPGGSQPNVSLIVQAVNNVLYGCAPL